MRRGESDVFEGRELGQEMEKLENEAYLRISQGGDFPGRLGVEAFAVKFDRPLVRAVQGA